MVGDDIYRWIRKIVRQPMAELEVTEHGTQIRQPAGRHSAAGLYQRQADFGFCRAADAMTQVLEEPSGRRNWRPVALGIRFRHAQHPIGPGLSPKTHLDKDSRRPEPVACPGSAAGSG
ncbi:hypothetical protein [Mycobacterium seoulense]|uniref:hypothetical protein n=1 Tax=Mycobacterium seoulense TaxID=386911 RepID=UPI003CE6D5BC